MHVRILKPSTHGNDYVNRKAIASLNVQATCNAKEIFTSIDAWWPGPYTIQESGQIQKSVNNSVEEIIMLFCWEIVDMV
jgi:hypothetical protein